MLPDTARLIRKLNWGSAVILLALLANWLTGKPIFRWIALGAAAGYVLVIVEFFSKSPARASLTRPVGKRFVTVVLIAIAVLVLLAFVFVWSNAHLH